MRYAAIPARSDGSDRLGTEGVIIDNYASDSNARRYITQRIERYGIRKLAPNGWNLYRVNGWAGNADNYRRIGSL